MRHTGDLVKGKRENIDLTHASRFGDLIPSPVALACVGVWSLQTSGSARERDAFSTGV